MLFNVSLNYFHGSQIQCLISAGQFISRWFDKICQETDAPFAENQGKVWWWISFSLCFIWVYHHSYKKKCVYRLILLTAHLYILHVLQYYIHIFIDVYSLLWIVHNFDSHINCECMVLKKRKERSHCYWTSGCGRCLRRHRII